MTEQQPSPTDSPAQPHRLLKLTLLAYRHPSMSEAEFHTHWSQIHSAKAAAHLAKCGIVSYRQYHTPSALRAQLAAALPSLNLSDDQIVDYDGFVELVMPGLDCFEKVRDDPYFKRVIAPDEAVFADMARTKVTVGWVEAHVEGGQVVEVGRREAYEGA